MNQWISFGFGDFTEITAIRYKADETRMGSSFKQYRFEYSSDSGSTWTSFHTGQGDNFQCCDWKEISLEDSPITKHFRLFMIDNWGYGYLAIAQLELKAIVGCKSN